MTTLAAGPARSPAAAETGGAKAAAAAGLAATDPAFAAIAGAEIAGRATLRDVDVATRTPDAAIGGTRTGFTDADGTLVVTARDVT